MVVHVLRTFTCPSDVIEHACRMLYSTRASAAHRAQWSRSPCVILSSARRLKFCSSQNNLFIPLTIRSRTQTNVQGRTHADARSARQPQPRGLSARVPWPEFDPCEATYRVLLGRRGARGPSARWRRKGASGDRERDGARAARNASARRGMSLPMVKNDMGSIDSK